MIKYEKKILKGLLLMRNVYTIQSCNIHKNEWICTLHEPIELKNIQPTGQLLTDSDNLAFIYIVVENDEYSYIQFPKTVWSTLLKIVQNRDKVFIQNDDDKIELMNFVDELEMLLFNIEGNGNYGEIFVETVEKIFEPVFKEANE